MAVDEKRESAPTDDGERRDFLKNASRAAMVAGLVGGYGGFGLIAGRYLYPSKSGEVMWQFVANISGIRVGEAIRYRGPGGEAINITRRSRNGDADDFIALSSTCPHLGCQVRWEEQNDRFFCPCHSGVFDPTGKAIAGPPGDAGQWLPRYALKVESGNLHIRRRSVCSSTCRPRRSTRKGMAYRNRLFRCPPPVRVVPAEIQPAFERLEALMKRLLEAIGGT